ncbi:MAG: DNA-binding protein [Candidatus Scalindua rubra]|uniref:DNA-binding protein n=1 Tax=Candidatus Scalindua rubra TaxID=1872076 RepID=A0A1E3X8I8_9BACT|nr:MAG: DNA-binding protein [Candidatus Scalindua rubra]
MSKKFKNQLKDRLQIRRDHLLKEIQLRLKEFKDSGGYRLTDTAEMAANIEKEEISMSVVQGEARELEKIDNALKKLKKGQYGICENCGKKINKQRLKAIPFVNLCIKCQEDEEREEGMEIQNGYYRVEAISPVEFEGEEEKSYNNIQKNECNDINPYDN